MSSRFETRLQDGPPLVGDGGMGVAADGGGAAPAQPEEANLRAPEAVVSLHVELHRGRRRADRDEQLRREPAQARRPLPRGRARAINAAGGEARPRRTRVDRPRRLHRRLDRAARRGGDAGEAPRALRRAGGDPRRTRRRPAHARDVLRPRGARPTPIAAVRSVSGLPIVALLTLRRRRRDARRRHRRRRRPSASPTLEVAAFGANHGAGLLRRAHRARADAGRRPPARRAAEHRPREPARRHGHLPARDARVLRRVRRPRRATSARG